MLQYRRVGAQLSRGVAPTVCFSRRAVTRDEKRYTEGIDPITGHQMAFCEPPDLTSHIRFQNNTLEHVRVPFVPIEERFKTDMQKEEEMQSKYGPFGPGSQLTKSIQQEKKDMLDQQQDIDGLPWELRWRRTLVPTQEEVVQDIRDRYELWEMDPIEREKQWYLHWKDRLFKIQRDRAIWPQGYTDYLDHYDENGTRRTLPTDQRWSDTSWKYLADTRYRDRMWMVETEERKAIHKMMEDEETLLLEAESKANEEASVYHGIQSGIIDLDPDTTYQALTGTADPMEVAKTKFKMQEYSAELVSQDSPPKPEELDPITGMRKSDRPPLPSGLGVEQAVAIDTRLGALNEMREEKAAASGEGIMALGKMHLAGVDPEKPKPALRTAYEEATAQIVEANRQHRKAQLQEEQKTIGFLTSSSDDVQPQKTTPADHPQHQGPAAKHDNEKKPAMADSSVHPSLVFKEPEGFAPQETGFIEVPERPPDSEAKTTSKSMIEPKAAPDEAPEWYVQTIAKPGPQILRYGIIGDPIEMQPTNLKYLQKPVLPMEKLVANDDNRQGDNVFDEGKLIKERVSPEFASGTFQPLPLYKDAILKNRGGEEAAKKKSELIAAERRAKAKSRRMQYDPDLALPDLPWETDPTPDPYRGITDEEAIDFNKKELEKTFTAYRECLQQKLVEFSNMTSQATEDKCELLIRDGIDMVREGRVGDHPPVAPQHEEIFKIQFEAHFKQYLSDWHRFRANRKPEADALKAESDDLIKKATAKAKQQGKKFMSFIQEMTTVELEKVKKNPVQRNVILIRDKKHELIAKPFLQWIKNELGPFIAQEFTSYSQLEQHGDFLHRHLTEARFKAPQRVADLPDRTRDFLVEAFYHWCRGTLSYYLGKHHFRLHLRYADSRFRGRAEQNFEDSFEIFNSYFKAAKECGVYIPVPGAESMYEFADTEYIEGENGYHAEIVGDLDRAERIWHTGTTIRWYSLFDETDFLHFYERRGRYGQAFEISERCLDAMNKKTHPSIHPFPSRGRRFLEGAPLTQETAEHLWLRYMGDLYFEHSEFHQRNGKPQTAKEQRNQGLNFYNIAIRTAEERLPSTWRAPLLTKAKYLCKCADIGIDVVQHIKAVEDTINAMYRLGEECTQHWVDRFTDMHYRIALIYYNVQVYAKMLCDEAQAIVNCELTHDYMLDILKSRAVTHQNLPGSEPLEDAMDKVAATFRKKILSWRSLEPENTDNWFLLTILYFTFRVRPKTPEEVDTLKSFIWKAYDYVYTQTALGVRSRGRFFGESIRRLCQILLPGTLEHKKLLLDELYKINDKMRHATVANELDRTISALELHLKDPSKPPYVYDTARFYACALEFTNSMQNPLLQVTSGGPEYAMLKEREKGLRNQPTSPVFQANNPETEGPAAMQGSETEARDPTTSSTRNILRRETGF